MLRCRSDFVDHLWLILESLLQEQRLVFAWTRGSGGSEKGTKIKRGPCVDNTRGRSRLRVFSFFSFSAGVLFGPRNSLVTKLETQDFR